MKISKGNSKMPGTTFSLDAFQCITGSKMRDVPGSVCEKCYAIRLQKFRPNVNRAWVRNHTETVAAIADNPDAWAQEMASQLHKSRTLYHRWFDSGDLQSVEMLAAICEVCRMTPKIRHWLPTREIGIVRKFDGVLPSNLALRVSAPMIGQRPVAGAYLTSTVHRKGEAYEGRECRAYTRGNQCGACRACWTSADNISYPLH